MMGEPMRGHRSLWWFWSAFLLLGCVRTPATGEHGGRATRATTFRDCAQCPLMVEIPTGVAIVGAWPAEHASEALPASYAAREVPRRTVPITRRFAVARHETTVQEYRRFVEATGYSMDTGCTVFDGHDVVFSPSASWTDPGYPVSESHPVVCVSWDDAVAYTAWLSELSGQAYRLPSEVEWEYVARAGRPGARYWEGGHDTLCEHLNGADRAHARAFPEYGWFNSTCDDGEIYPVRVGSYPASPWGVQDFFGNVSEWVADCWSADHSGPLSQAPSESGDCLLRGLRGGAALDMPQTHRAAWRTKARHDARDAYDGFRVARDK